MQRSPQDPVSFTLSQPEDPAYYELLAAATRVARPGPTRDAAFAQFVQSAAALGPNYRRFAAWALWTAYGWATP
jgi:hypothetical protein